ncbi:Uncharacterized protein dnm_022920 [Desulfonema magnum]|uniref:Uncharacterized protein n=1 Tax=Desulfonema magnum TaxID=45655 RepID=A0A975BJ49_9BACT|nr:Uncharacterized protein dnm_022920 [Desulfonema magnum]
MVSPDCISEYNLLKLLFTKRRYNQIFLIDKEGYKLYSCISERHFLYFSEGKGPSLLSFFKFMCFSEGEL